MPRKSKPVSTSRQRNLFEIQDESPNSETIEQAISGPQTPAEMPADVPELVDTPMELAPPPMPATTKCPQCGGPAALSLKESGKYYCQGACSYGDNFYFTI